MLVRDLLIIAALTITVVAIAFVASAWGSEFYVFVPPVRRMRHLTEPPTTPWLIFGVMAIYWGTFFASKQWSATLLLVVLALLILGLPTGYFLFNWLPGIAHFLLIVVLGSLSVFVWTHEDFHVD